MTFNNKTYDTLKWIAQYLLPGLGTLYFSLASIWGLPYAGEIVGSIAAVNAMLGILLGISSANYTGDGTLTINRGLPGEASDVDIDIPPLDELAEKDKVTLKIETVVG